MKLAYSALERQGPASWTVRSPGAELGYVSHHWMPALAAVAPSLLELASVDEALHAEPPFVYPIELRWEFLEWFAAGRATELAKAVPDAVFQAVRERRAVLLLFFAHEGRRLYFVCDGEVRSAYDLILELVVQHELPPQAVWFVHGNLGGGPELDQWRELRGIAGSPFEVRAIEFQSCLTKHTRRTHEAGLELLLDWDAIDDLAHGFVTKSVHLELRPRSREFHEIYADLPMAQRSAPTKLFLCMNRVARPHRRFIVCQLQALGLLDRSLVSFFDEHSSEHYRDARMERAWLEVQKKQPLTIDVELAIERTAYARQNFSVVGVTSARPYRETALSIVTETFFNGDGLFLSEKVWKPLVSGHPFILVGMPGSLEYLRSQGFKTFEPAIDESYDTFTDAGRRLQALCNQLEAIGNLSRDELERLHEALLPAARHNVAHLMAMRTPMECVLEEIGAVLGSP